MKNSSNCIYDYAQSKVIQKWTRLYPVLIEKKMYVHKKRIISSEKIRTSGKYMNYYAHSFFGEDLYWLNINPNIYIQTILMIYLHWETNQLQFCYEPAHRHLMNPLVW